MSLTRYLPLPSDRMGIIWNLLTVQDSIVLEYGPAGTTHYSMSLYGELGVDRENSIFTTHMSEDDVVMGDVSRLESAIAEIDQSYHPRVLFVVGSSVSSVIGTDITGVCRYMQNEVGARLITFDGGGFRGDYSAGCEAVWSMLAGKLVKPDVPKKPGTYNLIGASAGSYRVGSDIWELKSLLREALGLECAAVFCYDTSVDELENAGSAQLNIVLREEGRSCAEILAEKCGTPFTAGCRTPYGYRQTIEWLSEIGRLAGRSPSEAVLTRLREKAEKAAMYRMYGMMLKKDRPGATIAGEYHTVTGLASFLGEIGIPVRNRICLHSLKTIPQPEEGVLHFATEKERIDLLKTIEKELVLGDDISMRLCPRDNVFVRIALPLLNGAQIATHLPLAGERGADALLEKVEEYFGLVR